MGALIKTHSRSLLGATYLFFLLISIQNLSSYLFHIVLIFVIHLFFVLISYGLVFLLYFGYLRSAARHYSINLWLKAFESVLYDFL